MSFVVSLCAAHFRVSITRRSLLLRIAHITAIAHNALRSRKPVRKRDGCSQALFLLPLRECSALLLRDFVHTYTCGHMPPSTRRGINWNILRDSRRAQSDSLRRNLPYDVHAFSLPGLFGHARVLSDSFFRGKKSLKATIRDSFMIARAMSRKIGYFQRFDVLYIRRVNVYGASFASFSVHINSVKRFFNYQTPVDSDIHSNSFCRSKDAINTDDKIERTVSNVLQL